MIARRRILPDGFVESPFPPSPSGPGWVHEIKYDGCRLIIRRDGDTVGAVHAPRSAPGHHIEIIQKNR
jgi:hypothetical protein